MKRQFAFTFLGLGLLLAGLMGEATAEQLTCLAEVATGEGTLVSENGDRLLINAVAVLLRENGEGEVCLMTSKENVNLGGRWLRSSASPMIDFEITNDTKGGAAAGCGTVFLQKDCVPVARLTMTVLKADGKTFQADFIEKKSRPCRDPKAGLRAQGFHANSESAVSYFTRFPSKRVR